MVRITCRGKAEESEVPHPHLRLVDILWGCFWVDDRLPHPLRYAGCLSGSDVHPFAQFGSPETQRFSEPSDVANSRVTQATLNATDVGGIESGLFGQLFLSQSPRFSSLADILPEGGEDGVTFRHD